MWLLWSVCSVQVFVVFFFKFLRRDPHFCFYFMDLKIRSCLKHFPWKYYYQLFNGREYVRCVNFVNKILMHSSHQRNDSCNNQFKEFMAKGTYHHSVFTQHLLIKPLLLYIEDTYILHMFGSITYFNPNHFTFGISKTLTPIIILKELILGNYSRNRCTLKHKSWTSFVLQYEIFTHKYQRWSESFEIAMFLTVAGKLVNICTAQGISLQSGSFITISKQLCWLLIVHQSKWEDIEKMFCTQEISNFESHGCWCCLITKWGNEIHFMYQIEYAISQQQKKSSKCFNVNRVQRIHFYNDFYT